MNEDARPNFESYVKVVLVSISLGNNRKDQKSCKKVSNLAVSLFILVHFSVFLSVNIVKIIQLNIYRDRDSTEQKKIRL